MAASSAISIRALASNQHGLSIAICGQSLLEFDLSDIEWPGRSKLRKLLRSADAAFTDFEGTVHGPRAGEPTRALETLHTPSAEAIDFLADLGLTLVATSNNHAFDLGTGGILDTIDAMEARGISFAGTGRNLLEASAPAIHGDGQRSVGLVAAAAGFIREGGAATSESPGVNELRFSEGKIEQNDLERYLAAIELAAAGERTVIAYLHNHIWEPDNADTPKWQRELARAAVDAGAAIFVAHGAPLLHGVEIYRGAPLFHGLGSLFFQTRKEASAYGPLNWQALTAQCHFEGGQFKHARLDPWQLASSGIEGPDRARSRGVPQIPSCDEARAILERVAERSERIGYRLDHDNRVGWIRAA